MGNWQEMKKAFIQYRDDATLVAIPAPVTGYFCGVIKHKAGAYVIPSVDFELTLTGALERAEILYRKHDENINED